MKFTPRGEKSVNGINSVLYGRLFLQHFHSSQRVCYLILVLIACYAVDYTCGPDRGTRKIAHPLG